MIKRIAAFLIVFWLISMDFAFAAMSSTNFQIQWDNFNSGGDDYSSSTNYSLLDTIGDNASGTSTSGNYQISSGYRSVLDESSLSFTVATQANGTKKSFTAFSTSTKTVTLLSAGSFSVGQHVVLVENEGFAQKIAVGKLTNVSGTQLTVDAFSGNQNIMDGSPTGTNDFVYALSGSSAQIGSVSPTTEKTSVTMSSVISTGSSGYTVYVQTDGNLRTLGGQNISNVGDGSVTIGVEEYGASVTGTSAVGSGSDFAVTTAQQSIQSRSGATSNSPDRAGLIYKLAISSFTVAGSYAQNVYYTLTANY